MKRKKSFFLLNLRLLSILFIFLTLIFNSCEREGQVTIQFWHSMSGQLQETLDEICMMFQKENPNIKVKCVYWGNYTQLYEHLKSNIAFKKYPTISQCYPSWVNEFQEKQVLEDVSKYFEAGELDEFYTEFLNPLKTEDGMLSLPMNKSLMVMYYNADLLQESGISKEEIPRTWDQFINVCKLVIEKNKDTEEKYWGFATNGSVWFIEIVTLQKGGRFEGSKISEDEFIQALDFINNLIRKEKLGYIKTRFSHQDEFLKGRTAFMFSSIVSENFMFPKGKERKFNCCIAPIPYFDKPVNVISGPNIMVFKDIPEKQKKAAIKFLKYLYSDKINALWSSKTLYLPIKKGALDIEPLSTKVKDKRHYSEIMEHIKYIKFEPGTKEWISNRSKYSRIIEDILISNKPLDRSQFKQLK